MYLYTFRAAGALRGWWAVPTLQLELAIRSQRLESSLNGPRCTEGLGDAPGGFWMPRRHFRITIFRIAVDSEVINW